MWDMFLNSMKLFFKGKLFRESKQVLRQWLIGLAVAVVKLVLLVSLAVGALQPWLFRNLKYA